MDISELDPNTMTYQDVLRCKERIRDLYPIINRAQTRVRTAIGEDIIASGQRTLDKYLPERKKLKDLCRAWNKANGVGSPTRKTGIKKKYVSQYRANIHHADGTPVDIEPAKTIGSACNRRNKAVAFMVASGELSGKEPHSVLISPSSFYTTVQNLTGQKN